VAPLVHSVVINRRRVKIYAFLFRSLVNDWEANNVGMVKVEGAGKKKGIFIFQTPLLISDADPFK
jgi:hypothetical protein